MAIDKEKALEGRIKMGAALRSIREAENLSMEEVGEPIGISKQTLSKIENGRWSAGADHLSAIAGQMGYEWTLRKKK